MRDERAAVDNLLDALIVAKKRIAELEAEIAWLTKDRSPARTA